MEQLNEQYIPAAHSRDILGSYSPGMLFLLVTYETKIQKKL
jgi:hypothetical protein